MVREIDREMSKAVNGEGSWRYGSKGLVLGIPWVLKGVRASVRTIQGEIVVEKFLALNGPRGTYSQV